MPTTATTWRRRRAGPAATTAAEAPSDALASFATEKVINVSITMSEADLADLITNGQQEKEYPASLDWTGRQLPSGAVRAKGNSSLSQVARSANKRYSLKLYLDKYVDGQNLDGIGTIDLQNSFRG